MAFFQQNQHEERGIVDSTIAEPGYVMMAGVAKDGVPVVYVKVLADLMTPALRTECEAGMWDRIEEYEARQRAKRSLTPPGGLQLLR